MYILTFFVLYSSMLRSIKSNNSPGHFHNRLPSVVDLSTDFCPGIILKRNNKMKYPRHYFMVSLTILCDTYKSVYGLAKAMEREIKSQMEDDRTCILTRFQNYNDAPYYELYFDDPYMNWALEFAMEWQLALGKKYRVDVINGCTLGIYK